MNRKTKFRGWDTKKKIMYSPEEMGRDQLTISTDGRGFVNVNGQSTNLSKFYGHIIPEQFTGLKDKNDKEIYEGSKVRIDWKCDGSEMCELPIIWEKDDACFWVEDTCPLYAVNNEFLEVIGTIHDKEQQ